MRTLSPHEDIERHGILAVSRIEIHHVSDAPRRDVIKKFKRGLAVRVNHSHAATSQNILKGQIAEQGRLAGSALSEQI